MEKTKKIKIVIVEDDIYYNKVLSKHISTICSKAGYPGCDFEIKSYLSAHECIEELDDDTDIMVLDYYFTNYGNEEELNGEDVLKEVQKHCKDCKVIMISAMQDSHRAVDLMKKGIYEYIDKNVNSNDRIGSVIQRALNAQLKAENYSSV